MNAVIVERAVEMIKKMLPVKEGAVIYIREQHMPLTIQLLTVLMASLMVWANMDTMIHPLFLNSNVAFVFAVLGASSGSAMWNDALTMMKPPAKK
jgi:hypothetical protein